MKNKKEGEVKKVDGVNELVDVLIVNKPDNENNKHLRINLSSLEQLKLKKYIFEKV